MAFTYDISSADTVTLNLSKVRLEIGDTEENAGARPHSKNFSDAEIQMLIDREGNVMSAAAGACEILARQWARIASSQMGPLRNDYNHVSEMYAKQAAELRLQYGGGASGSAMGMDRTDGYSLANTQVTVTEDE